MGRYADQHGYIRESKTNKCIGSKVNNKGYVEKCRHPAHGCFPGDTDVQTPEGKRPIREIEVGDLVISTDRKSGMMVPRRVLRKKAFQYAQVYEISFASAHSSIRATARHSLLSGGNAWVMVRKLKKDDTLRTSNGALVGISNIQRCGIEEVFNLVVDQDYEFLVGDGIRAHSFTFARSIRMRMNTILLALSQRCPGIGTSVKAKPWVARPIF
jgi:hypothetical protein